MGISQDSDIIDAEMESQGSDSQGSLPEFSVDGSAE